MSKNIIMSYIIWLITIMNCTSNAPKTYGPFMLRITDVNICKGPKQMECCNIAARLKNGTHMIIDMEIKKNTIPTRGKIVATMNGKPLMRFQMKKPCDHMFMKPLFQAILNVTHECEFRKGHYNLDVDIEDVAKKYYGGMFLYGNLTFKSLFYNEECNVSCSVVEVNFSPKNATI